MEETKNTKNTLSPEQRKERDEKFAKNLTQEVSNIINGAPDCWQELFMEAMALYNGTTKRKYGGENSWTLGMSMKRNQFTDPRWYTKKQVENRKKLAIKPGQNPTVIRSTFCHPVKVKDKNGNPVKGKDGKPMYYWVSGQRYIEVFNGDQIDGLKPIAAAEEPISESVDSRIAEALKKNGFDILVDEMAPCVYLDGKTFHVPTIEEMTQNDLLIQQEEILHQFLEKIDTKPSPVEGMDSFSREMASLMILHSYSVPVTQEERDRKKEFSKGLADTIKANPDRFGKAMAKAQKWAQMFS
jgi:hypothetical protein